MEELHKNYYEILEVTADASEDDLRHAYLRAKNAYSGDSVAMYSLMTAEECQKILDQIELAYSVLSIPEKRKEYDRVRSIPNKYRPKKEPQKEHIIAAQDKKKKFDEDKEFKINAQHSISRLGIGHKFKLDYVEQAQKEQQIENTTQFTGATLKDIREYKKVNLDKISDWTKVSKTYLRYIENEEVEKLPALAFVRGFVYQYARCLKLNPELVATSYVAHVRDLMQKKGK